MRRLTIVLAIVVICLPPLLRSGVAGGNPFSGMDEKEVATHRRKARSCVTRRLRKWLAARSRLVYICPACQGSGKLYRIVGYGKTARKKITPCAKCSSTGARLHRDNYMEIFWNCYSPAVREDEKLLAQLAKSVAAAERNPPGNLPHLSTVTKTVRKEVKVLGNHATIRFIDRCGREKVDTTVELIEVDGDWWLAHPVADKDFPRHTYAGADDEPEAAPPAQPAPRPAPTERPGGAGGEFPPSAKPPPPTAKPPARPEKPLPEDPEGLFEFVGEATVRHSEENAYKVLGRIRNATKDRRFAYVLVEVSVFKGRKLIDTVTCNVGATILKPGDEASFSGYLYCDEKPEFDRVESKVAGFKTMK